MSEDENQKNRGGRPRKEINFETLKGCCTVGCTAEECAGILGVTTQTIDNRLKEMGEGGFFDFHKKHFDPTKQSLRRAQLKQAMDGNTTMLIWLGKQQLGQRDKHEVKAEGGLTIKWDKEGCEGI